MTKNEFFKRFKKVDDVMIELKRIEDINSDLGVLLRNLLAMDSDAYNEKIPMNKDPKLNTISYSDVFNNLTKVSGYLNLVSDILRELPIKADKDK